MKRKPPGSNTESWLSFVQVATARPRTPPLGEPRESISGHRRRSAPARSARSSARSSSRPFPRKSSMRRRGGDERPCTPTIPPTGFGSTPFHAVWLPCIWLKFGPVPSHPVPPVKAGSLKVGGSIAPSSTTSFRGVAGMVANPESRSDGSLTATRGGTVGGPPPGRGPGYSGKLELGGIPENPIVFQWQASIEGMGGGPEQLEGPETRTSGWWRQRLPLRASC
jgi:hypothetical protein